MWRATSRAEGSHAARPRIVITGPPTHAVSGIATHVDLLLHSSVRQRFMLEHLCAGGEGLAEDFLARALRRLITPLRLFAVVACRRPALVHINTSLNSRALPRDAALLLVAWLTRCPVVWQVHGGDSILKLERQRPRALAVLKMLLSLPRRVIVISREDELGYAKVVNPRRLQRISNAVQASDAPARAAPSNRFDLRITYLGRLVAGKGVLDLIEAMRIIVHQHPGTRIRLQLAGAGPLEAQLRARAAEYELGAQVQMLGSVVGAAKRTLFADSDVFVLPSFLPERLPYALLESMAAGLPAVACAVGGVTEVIEHGRTGLLVPPRRPDLLAESLLDLAHNRPLLQQMAQAARERVCNAYDVVHMAARFTAVYEDVLRERRAQ